MDMGGKSFTCQNHLTVRDPILKKGLILPEVLLNLSDELEV